MAITVVKILFGAATLVSAILALDSGSGGGKRRLRIAAAAVLFILTAATAAIEARQAQKADAARNARIATVLTAIQGSLHRVLDVAFDVTIEVDPHGKTFAPLLPKWHEYVARVRAEHAGKGQVPMIKRTSSWSTGDERGVYTLHYITIQDGSPLLPERLSIDHIRVRQNTAFLWATVSESTEAASRDIEWVYTQSGGGTLFPDPVPVDLKLGLFASGTHATDVKDQQMRHLVNDAVTINYDPTKDTVYVRIPKVSVHRVGGGQGLVEVSSLVGKKLVVMSEFPPDEVRSMQVRLKVSHGVSQEWGAVSECEPRLDLLQSAPLGRATALGKLPADCAGGSD